MTITPYVFNVTPDRQTDRRTDGRTDGETIWAGFTHVPCTPLLLHGARVKTVLLGAIYNTTLCALES